MDGGYAEYVLVRADLTYPLPTGLESTHVAPLLRAGIIGFRSLRVAGVEHGERIGLFGFGSSASLAIRILQSWKCDVYVVTRGEQHRKTAVSMGAKWVGPNMTRRYAKDFLAIAHQLEIRPRVQISLGTKPMKV